MTHDRCFNGILHSAERLKLDALWKELGVDLMDERAALIEARLIVATLREQRDTQVELERRYQATQRV